MPILGQWEEDGELVENSRRVASQFGSRRQKITIGETSSSASTSEAVDHGDEELKG